MGKAPFEGENHMDGRSYGIFNVAVEDLFGLPRNPRVWPLELIGRVRNLIPFKYEELKSISQDSDVVEFCETFAYGYRDDFAKSLSEFVESMDFYKSFSLNDNSRSESMLPQAVVALKYPFAYDSMLVGLVGTNSGGAGEIPYLAEAQSDLMCSVYLAGKGFHKQAIQVLRGSLEAVVAHGYFFLDEQTIASAYQRDGTFHMPRFSTKKTGMVETLEMRGVIGDVTANQVRLQYQELGRSVHNAINQLTIISSSTDSTRLGEFSRALCSIGELVVTLSLEILTASLSG